MNKPALMLSEIEKKEWDASDALIQKREEDLERIWRECNKRGQEAVQGVMYYIETLEGQNKRLNKRLEIVEEIILSILRAKKHE